MPLSDGGEREAAGAIFPLRVLVSGALRLHFESAGAHQLLFENFLAE
jgi:hypothetical protein